MILVGNQRGAATNLARHLMKEENERVDVHQIRGFASDDLHSALRESYAMSRATKCKQHLFSLSLNPPKDANLSPEDFEKTVDRAEEQLGLNGQPRAIVLHTKNGRTHAHAVWSRINTDEMRAVQMSFSKRKMQDLSRELYREHGWQMPRGFVRHEERDPRNFSLAEWQQCKRAKRDPAKTKEVFQDAWMVSDSRDAFASALKAHGFILAKGDRRGHVAVDHNGEAFAVARYTGVKTKQVRDRLGKPDELPSKDTAHKIAADRVTQRLEELRVQEKTAANARLEQLSKQAESQRMRHASEQSALMKRQAQERREQDEMQQARLRKGLLGFVDRLTGKRKRAIEQNHQEKLRSEEQANAARQSLAKGLETKQSEIQVQSREAALRAAYIRRELTKDAQQLKERYLEERGNEPEARSPKRLSRANSRRQRGHDGPSLEP
mmetsp:Transcript_28887/g.55055  ORF Transcript_28887/g.55055 Transcript_28887/m.55055 type:complete len:437 (+) Transcript_28887:1483-2793(+)